MGKQIITIKTIMCCANGGVNMIRKELLDGTLEFSLTGEGYLEEGTEEELKNWMKELIIGVREMAVDQIVVREMTVDQMMNGGGFTVDPAELLGVQQLLEILEHFFDF